MSDDARAVSDQRGDPAVDGPRADRIDEAVDAMAVLARRPTGRIHPARRGGGDRRLPDPPACQENPGDPGPTAVPRDGQSDRAV
jgi:hypothetical protein